MGLFLLVIKLRYTHDVIYAVLYDRRNVTQVFDDIFLSLQWREVDKEYGLGGRVPETQAVFYVI